MPHTLKQFLFLFLYFNRHPRAFHQTANVNLSFPQSMDKIREDAVAEIIDQVATLEDSLVECMEMCSFETRETPEEDLRRHITAAITRECGKELTELMTDPSNKRIGEKQTAALVDFLMDGVELFDDAERAAFVH